MAVALAAITMGTMTGVWLPVEATGTARGSTGGSGTSGTAEKVTLVSLVPLLFSL